MRDTSEIERVLAEHIDAPWHKVFSDLLAESKKLDEDIFNLDQRINGRRAQ